MHKQKRLTAFGLSAVIILFIAFNADYAGGIGVSGIPLTGRSIGVINNVDVIPGGNTVGIKLYTKGLLTVDTASFEALDGTLAAPAKESGIFPGDTILEIDGAEITSNEMFIEEINKRGETPLTLGVMRKSNRLDIVVTPRQATDKKYKIGVWVRDSAAGIGTMTFCRTDSGAFAALGHGISDGDIGQQYIIREGSIEKAEISAIVKGEKGIPGELKGVFTGRDEIMGRVSENGVCGLYGKMNKPAVGNPVKVASKWEVREGEAVLLCTTDSVAEEYKIEIQRIMPGSGSSSKAMIIKITDERLLAKTGGIVQGMSGSPILQNGKLAGAVTHVFVNDPTRGYAIFAETMLAETDKIR